MQVVDLEIEQHLVRTYETILDVTAEAQFELEGQSLAEEGWQLKQVSQRGTIVSPAFAIIAAYRK